MSVNKKYLLSVIFPSSHQIRPDSDTMHALSRYFLTYALILFSSAQLNPLLHQTHTSLFATFFQDAS